MTLDARGKYLRHVAQPVPWAPLALQAALRDEFEQALM
jgi:hypothetical protein